MSQYAPEFIIFVDDSKVDGNWIKLFQTRVRAEKGVKPLKGNHMEILPNNTIEENAPDSDPILDFPWLIECTPTGRQPEDDQVQFARTLLEFLRDIGCEAVLSASFEDRVAP